MATAQHLDMADGDTRALLDRLGDERIVEAIDAAIEARERDWVKWITREHVGEDESWQGTELHDWHLVSLHDAGEHVLAGVDAEVTATLDGRPERSVTATLSLLVALAETDGNWEAKFCEPQAPRRLTERFDAAFAYASVHHAFDARKGTQIPYVAHLLAVASLTVEMQSGSEDEAIAALLHDVVEDGGGMRAAAEIARRFGPDVVRIVLANSDTTVEPKPSWPQRKKRYIAAIEHKAPDELRVSLADKLHNARAILLDYRAHKEALWGRFNASRDATRWYYRELAAAFERRKDDLGAGAGPVVEELTRTVGELEVLVKGASAGADAPLTERYVVGGVAVERWLADGTVTRSSEMLGWALPVRQSRRWQAVLPYGLENDRAYADKRAATQALIRGAR
jgi:HD domain